MPHVLITGASSGIGAAVARAFAARDWAVGLVARREDRLRALADELGDRASFAVADVVDAEETTAAIRTLESVLGPVDLLLAAAGTSALSASTRFKAETYSRLMQINYVGVVHAIDAVLPGMLERGSGQIAAVSSLASYTYVPNQAAYCASKAALTSLLTTLSIELRPRGIAVTCVHPGYVDTPLAKRDPSPKPMMLAPEVAAEKIVRGLLNRRRRIDFPLLLAAIMRLSTALPAPIFEWVMGRAVSIPNPKRTNPEREHHG